MFQITANLTSHPRQISYALMAVLLGGSSLLLKDVDWQGSVWLHTLMESLATLLAFVVGAMALVRYFSQRDSEFLYIGSGFLGTALLDAYHTLVTSVFFQPYMLTAYPQLMPWSWIASRFFLSVLMFVSWWLWYLHRDDLNYRHRPFWVFSITGVATLGCFLFFSIMPLPDFRMSHAAVPRPFELLPAVFFLLALLGYLHKGKWRTDDFEHWLVLSLIVSLTTQTAFMPFSNQLHDTEFNTAHLLKKLSYLLVMTGLMVSLFQTYRALAHETLLREQAEHELRIEAQALQQSQHWFRALADYTYDWETWISPKGEILYASPSCERITGYSAAAFMSGEIKIETILSPHERIGTARHFNDLLETGVEELDFRIINKSGEERWINHVCQPIFDENGHFLGRRASNRDVTDRKLAETQNLALLVALKNAPVAVMITDATGKIEYVNPRFVEMTGYAQSEIIGQNPKILKSGEQSAEFYQHFWATLISGVVWTGELHNKRRDGRLYWEYAAISPVLDHDGTIKKFVAVKQDITEKKTQEESLYRKANFDPLTGLPNRTLFHDRLELALKKAARNRSQVALMMLDLDKFKAINDNLGHDAGDELLKQAADRMQDCLRDSDTVARVGGDEFMVLLTDFPNQALIDDIAGRLLFELARPFAICGQDCQVSASIGLAFSSDSVTSAKALKKNADIALYQAKGAGRNRVEQYSDS